MNLQKLNSTDFGAQEKVSDWHFNPVYRFVFSQNANINVALLSFCLIREVSQSFSLYFDE